MKLNYAVGDRFRPARKVLVVLACKNVAATMRRRNELRARYFAFAVCR